MAKTEELSSIRVGERCSSELWNPPLMESFESSKERSEDEYTTTDDDESDSQTENWIGHYSSCHRILLVGEGDFSFSLCLAKAFRSARNMVATSIDKQNDLAKKYNNGVRNVRELEEMGCSVFLGIDATKMSDHFFLRTQRFDRIIYNFPHVGFQYREKSYCQILLNKRLVEGFLKNSTVLLKEGRGQVHVSHKDGEPYDKWELVKEAEKVGLVLHETLPFRKHKYPGYNHKRAHGTSPDESFHLGECTTYFFKLNQQAL